jgi:protein phosphatase
MPFTWNQLSPFRRKPGQPPAAVAPSGETETAAGAGVQASGEQGSVPPLRLEVAVLTDPGCVRQNNEDSAYYTLPADDEAKQRKGVLVLVADGMGGASAGEVASDMAVRSIPRSYYESPAAPPEALCAAMEAANAEIFQAAQRDARRSGMGTTCVALAVWGANSYIAWVGDSRAYLIRDGQICQLTEDHSLVYDMVKRGLLSRQDARNHEDRNVLSRSLGGKPRVEVSGWSHPMSIREGDRFVLCSDGVHDLLTDEEILAAAGAGRPYEAVRAVVDRAKAGGGYDNITAAVAEVRLQETGEPAVEEVRATREISVALE